MKCSFIISLLVYCTDVYMCVKSYALKQKVLRSIVNTHIRTTKVCFALLSKFRTILCFGALSLNQNVLRQNYSSYISN